MTLRDPSRVARYWETLAPQSPSRRARRVTIQGAQNSTAFPPRSTRCGRSAGRDRNMQYDDLTSPMHQDDRREHQRGAEELEGGEALAEQQHRGEDGEDRLGVHDRRRLDRPDDADGTEEERDAG